MTGPPDPLILIEQALDLIRQALAEARANAPKAPATAPQSHEPETWREKLPRVPADTLLSPVDVAEALGKKIGWVYRRTAPHHGAGVSPLPVTRRDGAVWVKAGALRAWLAGQSPEQRRR